MSNTRSEQIRLGLELFRNQNYIFKKLKLVNKLKILIPVQTFIQNITLNKIFNPHGLASILWNINKQNRTRSDAAMRGVSPSSALLAYRKYF